MKWFARWRLPDGSNYLIVIDFDELEGLLTYLRYPAHEELGARFNESVSSALIYDFEVRGLGGLENPASSISSCSGFGCDDRDDHAHAVKGSLGFDLNALWDKRRSVPRHSLP
jgi:hypothetical protein